MSRTLCHTCCQFEFLVLANCKMMGFLHFEILKHQINRILEVFVVFSCFHAVEQVDQQGNVPFILRSFVMDVADQCAIEQSLGLWE